MKHAAILDEVGHRPWPLPAGAWVGHMRWTDLAFLHWPLPAAVLRPLIPVELEIEIFDGHAWLGLVPFVMSDVRVRWIPSTPGLSEFAELNLRTYVRQRGRAGVWFFSLDAASRLAVRGARALYNLPYFDAAMKVSREGAAVRYQSDRRHPGAPPASLRARYRPTGDAAVVAAGSLEHFLVERYCLFTRTRAGRIGRLDIHHAPWVLQPGEADIAHNTMADAAGITLPESQPLVHCAHAQTTLAWSLEYD